MTRNAAKLIGKERLQKPVAQISAGQEYAWSSDTMLDTYMAATEDE